MFASSALCVRSNWPLFTPPTEGVPTNKTSLSTHSSHVCDMIPHLTLPQSTNCELLCSTRSFSVHYLDAPGRHHRLLDLKNLLCICHLPLRYSRSERGRQARRFDGIEAQQLSVTRKHILQRENTFYKHPAHTHWSSLRYKRTHSAANVNPNVKCKVPQCQM